MNLQEIKAAIDAGKVVYWLHENYYVEKGGPTGLLVVHGNTGLPCFAVNESNVNDGEFFILENL